MRYNTWSMRDELEFHEWPEPSATSPRRDAREKDRALLFRADDGRQAYIPRVSIDTIDYDPFSKEYSITFTPQGGSSWGFTNAEEKPVSKHRVVVPSGVRFQDIVLVHDTYEYHLSYCVSSSGPLNVGDTVAVGIHGTRKTDQELVLKKKIQEAEGRVAEQREKYHAQRRAVEEAQAEKNRAHAALQKFQREQVRVNPFDL